MPDGSTYRRHNSAVLQLLHVTSDKVGIESMAFYL